MSTVVRQRSGTLEEPGAHDAQVEGMRVLPGRMLPGDGRSGESAERLGSPVRVHFLMFTADGSDGVCRSAINLANHLSRTHRVEIISLYRRRSQPAYAIDDRVRVSYLLDDRAQPHRLWRRVGRRVRGRLARHGSRHVPAGSAAHLSRLTDVALAWKLRRLRSGILISTRPTLHLMAARLAPRRLVTIGQDHLNYEFRSREKGAFDVLEAAARDRLDAFVTLTRSDEADYRRLFGAANPAVTTIPNALSWPLAARSPLDGRTIVTAGRLVRRKGVGRLIQAYLPLAQEHPDWQLHIYGQGVLQEQLQRLIDENGVADRVVLKGHTADLGSALEKASVFALASRGEGFPMVLLEAMSKGLPLVSFDCPRGPADLIRDGENGRLVPNGDIAGLTAALRELVESRETRMRMGACARADAEEFTMDRVAARWESLFAALRDRRRQPAATALRVQQLRTH